MTFVVLVVFFFSSRRRHTRLTCDWSSDVCSSDLRGPGRPGWDGGCAMSFLWIYDLPNWLLGVLTVLVVTGLSAAGLVASRHSVRRVFGPPPRSEERRVGKECRSRWSPYHGKINAA